jgi:hypothetical protein
MVDPHCVYEAEGIPPGIPAPDQSIARLGLRIPDHCWAWAHVQSQSKARGKKSALRFKIHLAGALKRESKKERLLHTSRPEVVNREQIRVKSALSASPARVHFGVLRRCYLSSAGWPRHEGVFSRKSTARGDNYSRPWPTGPLQIVPGATFLTPVIRLNCPRIADSPSETAFCPRASLPTTGIGEE